MKKKIFAVSDIHNEYNALIDALNKAGFDENNPAHLLVSIGDAFDRGASAVDVYKYLKKLSDKGSAIVLKGNHTNFLIDYLNGSSINPFNYINNGTDETLADFLSRSKPFESWCMIDKQIEHPTFGDFANWISEVRKEINNQYPELLEWLNTRPYYLETTNYIFTHGSIDTNATDWHYPHCIKHHFVDWEALMWDDGSFFGKKINNTDKTVVIGHFSTKHLREKWSNLVQKDKGNPYDILVRDDKRIIAIDGTSNYTHKVNVLIIENEEIINE